MLVGMVLACCSRIFALDPALDVSQYAHTALKIRDGFSKGIINSIAQTPDGYLWLGTEFGLLRFDGVRNVPWPPPDQPLPSNRILSLLAARDGTLWIGTANGLASWKDGKLTRYSEPAGQFTMFINRLLEDREGTVWAGTLWLPTGRLCAIRKGSVQCYGEDGSLGHGVFGLYEDRKGNLWAGVTDGLWHWKPGPPKFYSLPGEKDGVQGLAEDEEGALLIGTHDGIKRLVNGKIGPYPLPGLVREFGASKLLRDRDGGLWIGTSLAGLVHVHQGKTDVFTSPDGLSGDEVGSLFEDREGDVWVATVNGLDRFRDFAIATFSVKQGLSNAIVTSALAGRDGSVWLGTFGGLNRWADGQFWFFGKSNKRNGGLNGQNPQSLFRDNHGRIWVSTSSGVGYLENDRFIPMTAVPGGGFVHSFVEDNTGDLWIANQDLGLIHLLQERQVQQIPWAKLRHGDPAGVLAVDPAQGGLWLGFFQSGVAYFKDGEVRALYTVAEGLGGGRVNQLQVEQDGALWAATEGGLSRLKDGRVATLNSKNGLPCDSVHWVLEDDADAFWLDTACGVVRIARHELDAWAATVDKDVDKYKNAKRTIQVTVFDSSDGVRSHAIAGGYTPHGAKSTDGKLWFAGLDGVSVVDPRHLPFNKLPPPVHIEQITADRKTYDAAFDANGDAKAHLHLPPLVRDLEIDYTALSLVAPEKMLFRYKLEGHDSDWQDVGNRRQAFYGDLSPGNYRFRVSACNNSGVWNEAGTFLDFSIAPAYYQTTWFRVSCVAAFLALLWALHRLRLRQLAQQFNMRLEARVSERTRIARDLHDTLLQSFHGLLLRFQTGVNLLPERPAEARKTLESAIDQAAQAITQGRDAIQGLRSSTVETDDLALALNALGAELAADETNQNSTVFHVEVEGTPRNLHPILRDEVYRIAGEAMRNAFGHAQARQIEVEIWYDKRQLRLRVRDDGKGIDPKVLSEDGRAGHFGLRGMRERAKLMGGKLAVWSELDSGTEVELSIPASNAYEKSAATRPSWLSEKFFGKGKAFRP